MKPALLVIDVQKANFKENPVAAESLTSVIGIIQYCIGLFRKFNLPLICARNCVLSTYRSALDLDLTPMFVRDTPAGSHPENIPLLERIGSMFSYAALQKCLESLQIK